VGSDFSLAYFSFNQKAMRRPAERVGGGVFLVVNRLGSMRIRRLQVFSPPPLRECAAWCQITSTFLPRMGYGALALSSDQCRVSGYHSVFRGGQNLFGLPSSSIYSEMISVSDGSRAFVTDDATVPEV